MKTFAKVLSLTLLATVATLGFSQPLPPMGGQDHTAALKRLGLSDDQAKQVTELLVKERTAAVPTRAQIRVLSAQIDQAMTATQTDMSAVNALVDKRTQLRTDLEKQFLSVEAQVHQLVGDQLFYELRRQFFKGYGTREGHNWGWGSPGPRPMMQPAQP